MKGFLIAAVFSLSLLVSAFVAGCSSPPNQNSISPQKRAESEPTPEQIKGKTVYFTAWEKSEEINPMDGTLEVLLTAKSADSKSILAVRFRGKKLEVFVKTPEIVDDQNARVRIKFDAGEPIRQIWSRASNYQGVFSPNPSALLRKLQTSDTFYIEYEPFQRGPETIIFSVHGLSTVLPIKEEAQRKKEDAQKREERGKVAQELVRTCQRLGLKKLDDQGLALLMQWDEGQWASIPYDEKQRIFESLKLIKPTGSTIRITGYYSGRILAETGLLSDTLR